MTSRTSPPWDQALRLATGLMSAGLRLQQAGLAAGARHLTLMANTAARLWGQEPADVMPADARFQDDAWRENVLFDVLRQAYQINRQFALDLADSLETVDPELHRRAIFWTRQAADALSPSNLPLTNPAVVQETVRTGGANLLRGSQNLLADALRGRVSMVPEDAFQVGKDLAVTPGKVVYRNALIEVMQYSPATGQVHAVPMLVVPPWINKYYIMDMRPENSMFRYLVDAGMTVFAISWKNPGPGDPALEFGWDDYVTLGPLAALRVVQDITGAERVNLAGYCLGGVLLQTTLAYQAAVGDGTPNTATFFATHQDFEDAGDISVFISHPEVLMLEWLMDASGGYLDGRNMAATFNLLRANDLLWPYVVNNYMMGKEPRAFDLLYWNSDGTRVPRPVHSFLLRNLFLEQRLARPGGLSVKGIDLVVSRISVPTYTVAGSTDHIVPWRGAYQMRNLVGEPVRFVLGDSGHIAGIINPPVPVRRGYWAGDDTVPHADPDAWLAAATRHEGSWWPDWLAWLQARSGDLVPPPSMGSEAFPAIADAPGTYVLER